MKKALTGTVLLLITITAIWFARSPLLMGLANLYLAPYAVTLDCLDFDLSGLRKITINRLCLSSARGDIRLQQANWHLSEGLLNIDQADVLHRPQSGTPAEKPKQALEWQIPDLPAIKINNIQLSSHLLKAPLRLSLEYRQPQLSLSGPIMLDAKLEDKQFSGTLRWQPAALASLINLPANLDQRMLNSQIQTDWSFDGRNLHSQHQLNINAPASFSVSASQPPCLLQFEVAGILGLSADIVSQQAVLDLSALPIQLSSEDCRSFLPDSIAKWQPQQLMIQIPEPVNLSPEKLSIAQISISSESPLASLLEFRDVTSDFQQLSAGYRLDAQNSSAHWQGSGNLSIDDITDIGADSLTRQLSVSATEHQVNVEKLDYKNITLSALQLQLEASYAPEQGLETEISTRIDTLFQGVFKLEDLTLDLGLSSADLNTVQGNMDIRADRFTSDLLQLAALRHNNRFGYDGDALTLKGTSHAGIALVQGTEIKQPTLTHQAHTTVDLSQPAKTLDNLTSAHRFSLTSGFYAELLQQHQQLHLKIPAQQADLLNKLLQQQSPALKAGQGEISANLYYQSDTGQHSGNLTISHLHMAAGNYLAKDINLMLDVSHSSGKLQIPPAILSIESLQTGVDIRTMSARIKTAADNVVIEDIRGHLFDGQFQLNTLRLTDEPQTSLLTLSNLDMARILALQQETGIDVQGRISGKIPLHIHERQVEIRNGSLFNLNQGKLLISDNAAFAALKQNQPQLEPVLSLLQNLEFTQLNSDVSMQPDGLLFLDMQIKGHNPDKKQDVNFNYTHEENIFTLLRALRLGEEIQDKLEQGIK